MPQIFQIQMTDEPAILPRLAKVIAILPPKLTSDRPTMVVEIPNGIWIKDDGPYLIRLKDISRKAFGYPKSYRYECIMKVIESDRHLEYEACEPFVPVDGTWHSWKEGR
jgi:hypothetical protein